jgi:TatD DNase family protein
MDSHCHLDAPEFEPDRSAVLERARAAGVGLQVLPAVTLESGRAVQALARQQAGRHHLAYGLGLHPLYVAQAPADVIEQLAAQVAQALADPHFVAVGEIGIDGFVPGLDLALQERLYAAQLGIARRHGLPVILHVRRSADLLLRQLRRTPVAGGIAHAFNGSLQQAQAFIALGFRLGFGATLCYERSLQIRRLATDLPLEALVLETDAPDIPPPWRYTSAERRAAGEPQGRNEPAELPRIGAELARLRGLDPLTLMTQLQTNTLAALPRLGRLLASTTSAETSTSAIAADRMANT